MVVDIHRYKVRWVGGWVGGVGGWEEGKLGVHVLTAEGVTKWLWVNYVSESTGSLEAILK